VVLVVQVLVLALAQVQALAQVLAQVLALPGAWMLPCMQNGQVHI
jgi:hypothetical protein